MGNFPHRIRRQSWALRTGSKAAAFTLRQRLRDDWQELLLPAFDKAFEQEAGDEEVLHIPKIELRLKVASEDIAGSWPGLIHEQLVAQLQEIVRDRPAANGKRAAWRKSGEHENRLKNLLHYLRTGSANWEAAGLSSAELAVEFKKTCHEQRPGLQKMLRASPAPAPFCFRLLQLIPAAESGAAVRAILGEASSGWEASLLEILTRLLASEESRFGRHGQLQLAALLLSEVFAARRNKTAPDFGPIARPALQWESEAPGTAGAIADFISKAGIAVTKETLSRAENSTPEVFQKRALPGCGNKTPPDLLGSVRGVLPPDGGALQDFMASPPAPPNAKVTGNSGDAGATAKEPAVRPKKWKPVFSSDLGSAFLPVQSAAPAPFQPEAAGDFALLAVHAGLILLHPFLPRFFECTGIKEEAQPELSPFTIPRGAALLHFLATGRDAIFEYELVFIKVLLGANPEMPLCVSEGLLGDAERQEAEGLLQSAVSHWTALKNTSVAGFRSSFLERRALLRNEENGWQLQVERQPFDVLLEHLPWSISVVKLPWMKQPLFTEW